MLALDLQKPQGRIISSSSPGERRATFSGAICSPKAAQVFSTLAQAVFCTSTAWNITR